MSNKHINLIYVAFLLVSVGLTHFVNPWLGVFIGLGAFLWAMEAKRGAAKKGTEDWWYFPLGVLTLFTLPLFMCKKMKEAK